MSTSQNVDVIKVSADENLTVPELAAVIEEAHRQHLKVAVHAIDATSIQTAIDRQLNQTRDKGIFFDLTPTSYGSFFLKIQEPSILISPAFHSANAYTEARRQRYRATNDESRADTSRIEISRASGSRPQGGGIPMRLWHALRTTDDGIA